MEVILLVLNLVKLIAVSFLFFAAYFVYIYLVNPFLIRARYRKYKNVEQSKDFQFMKGDIIEITENNAKGVFQYWHYVELAIRDKTPDIYLKFAGPKPIFLMFSPKALREFIKLQPDKIDRNDYFIDRYIGKIFYRSLIQGRSTDNWKKRRDTYMKTLGINFASRYIGTLIDVCEKAIEKWPTGKMINFTEDFGQIEFDFVCRQLFGHDYDKMNLIDYKYQNGTYEKLNMFQCLKNITLDTFNGFLKPIGVIFPFLNDYNLIKPYTVIMHNMQELRKNLTEFLKITTDNESFYAQIRDMNQFTEDEIISDLLVLLFAGTDTTSHATASIMFFIKRDPEILDKCRKTYEEIGLIKDGKLQKEKMTMRNLDKCDYPNYVIKEAFRIDHTAAETVSYEAFQDIEICGVSIPKGSLLSINMFGPHYSTKEWHDPVKFIPERFDPESKYFLSPSTGKSRDPLSFIPFSIGMRACPGQTMAKLVQRVVLPLFISRIEYSLDSEQAKNEKILFNNYSQFHMNLTIDAKH